MKMQNKWLPLTNKELKLIENDNLAKLFLFTGIRRFELKQLLNNDYVAGAVRITGKGSKTRIIPMNDTILGLIRDLKGRWGQLSLKSINNHFKGLYDNIHPHRLRATFATSLLNNGVSLVAIQTLMGHSNIQTTSEYIKINVKNLKESIDLLTDPKLSIDGMNINELRNEVVSLRRRINRCLNNEK